ncbi:methyl-accepting chemotaxis protein [Duganella qianjiadongensis]|uniref:HAMP domain-containing protein n=1 Tax=Duganella qianjiadongensis TaxID=2692176 RepID=A0ABW9VN63_9BURK|nr:methyl-accepting chemotaxis protein [Duganella qianjiadongensis]MYM41023.1 HAMP domain-containing protein [Duganella qianjiadongensis]
MLSRFSIRQRLIAVMAMLGILTALLGGMSVIGLHTVNSDLREVNTNAMPSALAIDKAQINLLRARLSLDRVSMHIDAADTEKTMQRAEDFIKQSDAAWAEYLALPADAEEQALAAEMTRRRHAFLNQGLQPLLQALRAGEREKADQLIMTVNIGLFSALQDSAAVLTDFQSRSSSRAFADSQQNFRTQLWLTGGIGALALLMMVLGSYSLLQSVMGPVHSLMQHFRRIAEGDLSAHISVRGQDEMSALMRGLESMQEKLALTVREVRDGASAISVASSEIAAGNLDLSRRTENQAANIEETASSLEQLTATVQHNAENAQQSSTLAREAAVVAERGGQIVGQVVSTMDEIRASSTRIADIIGVIDGIAFQTNILALNAAVEAARAGEQGRGFAVVATEVRSLAHRSAEAAKDIKALITASVQRVDAGSVLVDEAGNTMVQIVHGIQQVAANMQEISAAGREQEAGIEQINHAVGDLDALTQQNAALVEQAAAASQAMHEQAERLASAVAAFRLDNSAPLAARRSQPVRTLLPA